MPAARLHGGYLAQQMLQYLQTNMPHSKASMTWHGLFTMDQHDCHSRLVNIALNLWQLASDFVDEMHAQLVGQVLGASVVKVPAAITRSKTGNAAMLQQMQTADEKST
jgi:hypothetical protein